MSAQRLSLIYLVKELSGRENQNTAYSINHNRLCSDLSDATQVTWISGGAMRDRTADLLRARQALSQLSYSPR